MEHSAEQQTQDPPRLIADRQADRRIIRYTCSACGEWYVFIKKKRALKKPLLDRAVNQAFALHVRANHDEATPTSA